MPLGNYTCFPLQYCSIKAYNEFIKKADNLERSAVIGSYIDFNIRLRNIASRKIIVIIEGFNIRNNIEYTTHE